MKIISGGQTGADRAALDVALELGIDYGGSIPKGRLAEDGPIDQKYDRLTELNTEDYDVRTKKNIEDADATLIFTEGTPTGGTALTAYLASEHEKSCLVVDFNEHSNSAAGKLIKVWLQQIRPTILNVAGPRESKTSGIYAKVYTALRNALQQAIFTP